MPLNCENQFDRLYAIVSRNVFEEKDKTHANFSLQWIICPRFAGDLAIYAFRPHGKHLKVEYLDVTFASRHISRAHRAMVMICSNELFAKLRQGDTNLFHPSLTSQAQEFPELIYALNIFHILLVEAVTQLSLFLKKACEEINYMVCCTSTCKNNNLTVIDL